MSSYPYSEPWLEYITKFCKNVNFVRFLLEKVVFTNQSNKKAWPFLVFWLLGADLLQTYFGEGVSVILLKKKGKILIWHLTLTCARQKKHRLRSWTGHVHVDVWPWQRSLGALMGLRWPWQRSLGTLMGLRCEAAIQFYLIKVTSLVS